MASSKPKKPRTSKAIVVAARDELDEPPAAKKARKPRPLRSLPVPARPPKGRVREDYARLEPESHAKHARLAVEIAEALERSGLPNITIKMNGVDVVGFLCPYCRLLAWARPDVDNVSFHDGQGCSMFHELGPIAFLTEARKLGRLPPLRRFGF